MNNNVNEMMRSNLGSILRKQFPNARKRGGTQKIDINLLHADLPYQKNPNKRLIKYIKDNFSPIVLDALVVSYRDGKYNVVDGQHRLCAIRELCKEHGGTFNVECKVIDGLSKEEECRIFKLLSDRRTVSSAEKKEAEYEAGDRATVEMVDSIRNVGFIVDFRDSKGENKITAIDSIEKIYTDLGKDDFIKYLKLIKETWNGDPTSLQRFMLFGVYEFFKAYRFNYDEKIFIKKLGICSPNDIQREGKSDLVSKGYTGYAKAIFLRYNKGLKEKNRLESKW